MSQHVFSEEQRKEIEKIFKRYLSTFTSIPSFEVPLYAPLSQFKELKILLHQNERAIKHNYEYLAEKMVTKSEFNESINKLATKEDISEIKKEISELKELIQNKS